MKKLILALTAALLFVSPAWAQQSVGTGSEGRDYPRGELFGGFSLINIGDGARENLFGAQASISGNFHRNLGLTADFGGQFRDLGGITVQQYELLFGPQFSKRGGRFTGFAHALAGVEHFRVGAFSDNGFALGIGGGLDVNLNDRWAVRPIQLDYIPNHFGGQWFHDVRYGAGVVVKFGR